MNKLNGVIIVLLSTLCYASLTPLLKKTGDKLGPFTMMFVSMFVLFSLSFILSIFFENSLSLKYGNIRNQLLILVLVGLINTIGFWLLITGFKYMPVWQQSLFNLLIPPIAGVIAYFILGEQMSLKLFLGLSVMGIGLFIAIR